MSILTSRSRLGALLGVMFGGKRDLYKVFGYSNLVTYKQSYGKYCRQDIVGRCIDAPADALWTKPPTLTSDNEAWNKAWQELVETRDLWNVLARVDRLAGLGEYSVLLLGFDGGQKLDQPISGTSRKVIYLQPYSCDAAVINKLDENPSSENFMKPLQYDIRPANESDTNKAIGKSFVAHSSRVLHVVENPLTTEVFGNSRIERIYNLTDDLLKVVGGTAETFWLTGNKGLQVDVDKDMELTQEDAKDLNDEIEEYSNQLRRVLRTRGVKITSLGSDVPDPNTAFNMLISLMSGATGIPKRILLGSEAGQLASDQDRNNWAERIIERRTNFGNPQIIKPLVRKLTAAGVLPEAKYTIEWPDAFVLSPLERAQTSAQRARSAVNMAKTLETQPELLTKNEARSMIELPPTEDGDEPIKDANPNNPDEAAPKEAPDGDVSAVTEE